MLAQIIGITLVTAFTGLLLVLRQSIGRRRTGRWPRKAYFLESNTRNSDDNDDSLPDWPDAIELHPETEEAASPGTNNPGKTKGPATLLIIWLAVAAVLTLHSNARAQSTIFNIPTADIVASGKTYLEFDFIAHPESLSNGGFREYVPRAVLGLGHHLEAGINLAVTNSISPSSVYVEPNVKWQIFSDEKAGTAIAAGAIGYLPVKNTGTYDSFGMFYLNGSKKFGGAYGPRFTAGPYGLVSYSTATGPNGLSPSLGGIMLGYEQPLSKQLSLVSDWFSGNNGLGYATPGISLSLPRNASVNVGYSIGNTGRKNNGLFLYYGKTL